MKNVRKDFPILTKKVNGHPLVYFDNAATTQKPYQVIHAMVDLLEHYNGNPHRGAHTLSIEATELYDSAREAVARFINAKSADEVIFVRNTTEAMGKRISIQGTKSSSPFLSTIPILCLGNVWQAVQGPSLFICTLMKKAILRMKTWQRSTKRQKSWLLLRSAMSLV